MFGFCVFGLTHKQQLHLQIICLLAVIKYIFRRMSTAFIITTLFTFTPDASKFIYCSFLLVCVYMCSLKDNNLSFCFAPAVTQGKINYLDDLNIYNTVNLEPQL